MSWCGVGDWGGAGGLLLREKSERERQEEKATALEQSPKLRSALPVVIFAPTSPSPSSLGFAKPGLPGVSPELRSALRPGCKLSPLRPPTFLVCAPFSDALALATPRSPVSSLGSFFFGVCVYLGRGEEWRPSIQGVKNRCTDTFGIARLETFACAAEMKLSVVVSERAPARMIFLSFFFFFKVIYCHLGLSCCLLSCDLLSELLI